MVIPPTLDQFGNENLLVRALPLDIQNAIDDGRKKVSIARHELRRSYARFSRRLFDEATPFLTEYQCSFRTPRNISADRLARRSANRELIDYLRVVHFRGVGSFRQSCGTFSRDLGLGIAVMTIVRGLFESHLARILVSL
jgi:hypothetical protein